MSDYQDTMDNLDAMVSEAEAALTEANDNVTILRTRLEDAMERRDAASRTLQRICERREEYEAGA